VTKTAKLNKSLAKERPNYLTAQNSFANLSHLSKSKLINDSFFSIPDDVQKSI
jgi:hypothetical protein